MNESSKESILLAGLDLTSIDDRIIPFARSLARFYRRPRLRFVHAVQRYDLESSEEEDADATTETLDRALRPELLRKIRRFLPDFPTNDLLLPHAEEDAARDMVKTAASMAADLLIVGEKAGSDRSHWYSRRLAANAPCPVAVFPDQSEIPATMRPDGQESPGWKTLLFASDFSKEADSGLSFCLESARALKMRLGLHLLRDVSGSFFPFLRHRKAEGTAEATRRRAEKALRRLGASMEQIAFITSVDEDPRQNEAQRLLSVAGTYQADLVVLSAQGKSDRVTDSFGHHIECLGRLRKQRPFLYFGSRD